MTDPTPEGTPLRITHGEDGAPITRATLRTGDPVGETGSDEDLDLH